VAEPRLIFTKESERVTRVDLLLDDKSISRLWIIRFEIRIGAATVKMDGIGGVGTDEEYRNRGYSRRVLDATVERMRAGDGDLSMLYGISNFYPKFGYATAGPEQFITLRTSNASAEPPPGWRIRPFRPDDLPALQRLYDRHTADAVGTAVRDPNGSPWTHLEEADAPEQCRVVEDPDSRVRAYVWRASWHWSVQLTERHDFPDKLVLGEVIADGPLAADTILSVCRTWGAEEAERASRTINGVVLASPPEGPVAAAAMHQSAEFSQHYSPSGGSMARVLDTQRLLTALAPELSRRWQSASTGFRGQVRIDTEVGSAALDLGPEGVRVFSPSPLRGGGRGEGSIPEGSTQHDLTLPQATLVRLALGPFPPEDLLARLETPPPEEAVQILAALFSQRRPHMHLPDRY
jgi:hypothetical protein